MATYTYTTTKVPVNPRSRYGNRILSGKPNFHKGTDFLFGSGTPVSSWFDGKVIASRYDWERGYYVEVETAPGFSISYHNLQNVGRPSVGQFIKRGDTVGKVGNSALGSTGPHLHVGMWLTINGVKQHVNLEHYLKLGTTGTFTWPVVAAPTQVSGKVVVDGKFGPATVKALQKALGQVQDGIFATFTKKALQRKLGQVADGNFGPQSIKALQRFVGAVADGRWGTQTTRLLQQKLNSGFGVVPIPASKPAQVTKVVIDGKFGPATVKALQKALGQVQDGSFGAATKKALQRKLGQKQDGIFGTQSIKALQRFVGAVADGRWGTQTTRLLQQKLNSGF